MEDGKLNTLLAGKPYLSCRDIVKVVEYPGSRAAAMQIASNSLVDELPEHESTEPHAADERRE